jgi:hypothetical protein
LRPLRVEGRFALCGRRLQTLQRRNFGLLLGASHGFGPLNVSTGFDSGARAGLLRGLLA